MIMSSQSAVIVVGLFCACSAAFAPITWAKSSGEVLVLMPENFAGHHPRSYTIFQKLTIGAAIGSVMPYFTSKPDSTISMGDGCVEAAGRKSGSAVIITSCSGALAQQWNWIPDDHGRNMIQLKDTVLCLDVDDKEDTFDGAAVELQQCENLASASWMYETPRPAQTKNAAFIFGMRHVMVTLMALVGVGALSLGAGCWQLRSKATFVRTPSSAGQKGAVSLAERLGSSSLHPKRVLSVRKVSPAIMALSPIPPTQEGETLGRTVIGSCTLKSVEETEALGAFLAQHAARGDVFFLHGELGVGKTALSRGFVRAFFQSPELDVPSPTYLLHFQYQQEAAGEAKTVETKEAVVNEKQQKDAQKEKTTVFQAGRFAQVPNCAVHHFDPYRLPEGRIAGLVDFQKIFSPEDGGISLVEWPQRLGSKILDDPGLLNRKQLVHITFSGIGVQSDAREMTIEVDSEFASSGSPSIGADVNDSTAATPSIGTIVSRWADKNGALLPLLEKATLESKIAELRAQHAELRAANSGGCNACLHPVFSDENKRRKADIVQAGSFVVLGIESSCDDTGVAIVRSDGKILAECVASQAEINEIWGGVKPDAAQQAHKDAIHKTVDTCIQRVREREAPSSEKEQLEFEKNGSKFDFATKDFSIEKDVDAIAVTVGPGLGLCLEVGVEKACRLAHEYRKPLVRIHHMEAHAMVTRMPNLSQSCSVVPDFPYLTLLVSGGHNMLVLTEGLGQHRILGSTMDDSVGEAFDKTARLLGIKQVPGGPHLEKLAKEGSDKKYYLAKPLQKQKHGNLKNGCEFSFSGLKTGVKLLVEKECGKGTEKLASGDDTEETAELRQKRADVAACFQKVAVGHLVERTERAVKRAQAYLDEKYKDNQIPQVKTLVVAGGVAANGLVRSEVQDLAKRNELSVLIPPPKYCVDNGVMVAWTGIERAKAGLWDEPPNDPEKIQYFLETLPKWPIGERDGLSENFKEQMSQKMKKRHAKREARVVAVANGHTN